MDEPRVVSADEWLAARRDLLAREKEFTRHRDALNTCRRQLPMAEVGQEYIFRGEGCESCSFLADGIGHLAHLHARDTTLAMVSRAPLPKIEAFRQRMSWTVPWYSCSGSDFNYDFHVTLDPAVARSSTTTGTLTSSGRTGTGGPARCTASAPSCAAATASSTPTPATRGAPTWSTAPTSGDLTARGRQEDWEHPPGRSDGPLLSWLRHHDRYGA